MIYTSLNNKTKAVATLPKQTTAPIKKKGCRNYNTAKGKKAMMNTENRDYLLRVREEIEEYYNGFDNEDGEEVSLYDYLSDILDFEITINSRMEYSSCKVWITLGGPNVWIDTAEREIKLAWGGERDSIYLDSDICDEIDSYFEEFYNCR